MNRKKNILLLLAFFIVCGAAYSQRKYTIKKGDTVWSVAKAMLKSDGVTNPSSGEVMHAIEVISEANGCNNSDNLRIKFFSDKAIARGSRILIPLDLKIPPPEIKVDDDDHSSSDALIGLFVSAGSKASMNDSETHDMGVEKKEETKPEKNASTSKGSSIVTNKTMTFTQMVKRPFGVLSEDSKGKKMADVEKELGIYTNWKPSKTGIDYDLEVMSKNGYDMRFLGVVPDRAECGFIKYTSHNELNRFGYRFRFEKKKDAETFRDKVLTELKSIGGQFDNNYYGDVRAKYGSSYIVVSINKDTKIVRVEINYMENGSWIE